MYKRKDDCVGKKIRLSLIFVILAVIFIAFVLPAGKDILNIPVSDESTEVLIKIEPNMSTLEIGGVLKSNDLIRSKFAFLFKAKTNKNGNLLASGTYILNKSMSIAEIIAKLSEPKKVRETTSITFPEGYSVEQMALLLEEEGIVTKKEFLDALDDDYSYEFIKKIPKGEYKYALQGFLFPNTYEFYTDSTANEIINRMLKQFNDIYLENALSFENVFDIITKASIIEREAKLDKERPKVAGVLENRIKKNMAFQVDATVIYAATDGMYDITDAPTIAKHINSLDSPYNTYKYAGLPAGPICNPGLTSIKAALNPESHPYLYYHTDTQKNDGSHIFTESLNQHINTMR